MSEEKKIPSINELFKNMFGFKLFNKNEKIIDEEPYEQYIKWDNEALIELSDVLIIDIKRVIIKDISYNYIKSIETNNILADIIKVVQEYYNKVKKEHRCSCFYIERIIVEQTKDKILIQIQHGT